MKLRFNLAFDGNLWPDPLSERDAVWGDAWVGPMGLLGHLETQLGLGGLVSRSARRDAALVSAVQIVDGFWTDSAGIDPLGTARTLRRWRDHLVLHGWQPEKIQRRKKGRLAALARVTREILPGMPDRLWSVHREMATDRIAIESLALVDQPVESLPLVWRQIILRLEEVGVVVAQSSLPTAKRGSRTDLACCFDKGYVPKQDGTLQLVRSAGPLGAAEAVAVWLSECQGRGALDGTVLIGGDALLDRALRQRGVPTTGGPSVADGDPLLAVLPLVIQLGWGPTDAQAALDLLLLRESPVPAGLAGKLAKALSEFPAVGSDLWTDSLSERLAKWEPEARTKVETRLSRLFQVDAPDDRYGVQALKERIRLVETWARGRGRGEDSWRWDGLVLDCASLRELVSDSGLEDYSEAQLDGLLSEATSASGEYHSAQVGLHRISSPRQMVGPAQRVLWWDCTRSTAYSSFALPLSAAERADLEQQGVQLPDPGQEAMRARDAWLRPFSQTTQQLVLVSPRLDVLAEPAYPHPIWDEVVGRLGSENAARLEGDTPAGAVPDRTLERLPLPVPAPVWFPGKSYEFEPPESLSPSSLGKFLGCPLSFALDRDVGLSSKLPMGLPDGSLLKGRLVHRLFERLLGEVVGGALPEPEALAERAGEIFDEDVPRLNTSLYQMGQERELALLRSRFTNAAEVLARSLGPGRTVVTNVEQSLSRRSRRYKIGGYADLVVDRPAAVIDHKWWGKTKIKSAMKNGAAYQLAIYAWALAKDRKALPTPAYFFVESPELVTITEGVFDQATVVGGVDPAETFAAVRRAADAALDERSECRISCGGTPEDPDEMIEEAFLDEDGNLWLPPQCGYCAFESLCAQGGVR